MKTAFTSYVWISSKYLITAASMESLKDAGTRMRLSDSAMPMEVNRERLLLRKMLRYEIFHELGSFERNGRTFSIKGVLPDTGFWALIDSAGLCLAAVHAGTNPAMPEKAKLRSIPARTVTQYTSIRTSGRFTHVAKSSVTG